jgi:hypothetical protein
MLNWSFRVSGTILAGHTSSLPTGKNLLPTLPEGWEEMAAEVVQKGLKISSERVIRISRLTAKRIPNISAGIAWVEIGYQRFNAMRMLMKGAGFLHMLKHRKESEELGVQPSQLPELAEAATTIGTYAGIQKDEGRVILGLASYGMQMALAITVGSNGFVVGMNLDNKRSRRDFAELVGIPEGELAAKAPCQSS